MSNIFKLLILPMKKEYQLQTWADNKILRTISDTVETIDDNILNIAENLLKNMFERDGVWLAAPQMGINLRIIAVTQWRKDKLIKELIMINPQITYSSDNMIIQEEACLSLPNITGKVKRHQSIIVEYIDIKWNRKKQKLKNFNSVIVQHEIDHLDGILFIDRAIPDSIQQKT